MIRAVIFDVDGTLVDSVDLHARAWQETFREFGKDIPFQEIRMQIGKGADQLIPVFLSKAELEDYGKRISNRRGKIFQEKYRREVKGFPRVRELFQRVLADGKKSLSRHIKKLPISRTYSTPKPLPMMQNNQSRIPIFS